jgi:hypothetical protein
MPSPIPPDPPPLDKSGWWAFTKRLAVEKRLRLLVRQLLRKGSSLISRQRSKERFGAAASKKRQREGN